MRVYHEEKAPYLGRSEAATARFCVGVRTSHFNPPTNPMGFVGPWNCTSIGLAPDGTYGLEVTATELPSFVQFEVVVETAIGSGLYGSYSVPPGGVIQSVADGPTRFVGTTPLDGIRRSIRAKHIRIHQTDSAYTTPMVNPGLYAI
ncbi:MAG: hypothetical protein IRY91_04300 [Gemmatimonadaceae bacterium]|nr:hypothetical protein [Gemmatimonadaceae bacterium]